MQVNCFRTVLCATAIAMVAMIAGFPVKTAGRGGERGVASLPNSTNRFVATNGKDTSNDCSSQSSPCATIGHAMSQSAAGDTINVAAGTYFENVVVSESVTIQGDELHPSMVNGGNANPVFTINSGVTASLISLTLANGNGDDVSGGGLSNSGSLTVTNCRVIGNSAGGSGFGGGISNFGVLAVASTTIAANSAVTGGGIYNNGMLSVTDTTIRANSAATTGAGIGNARFATLEVTGTTISGNSARDGGGAISNVGTLTITNSTISGNLTSSNAGGIDNLGAMTITNSTISGNSLFGVFNHPGLTMNLTNTIIAGSCINNSVIIGVNDHNLIESGNCAPFISAKPKLRPLRDNGGPTLTHALRRGSPAIDAGDDSVLGSPLSLTTDQRGAGFARKSGLHVDIGAFEFQFDMSLKDSSKREPAAVEQLNRPVHAHQVLGRIYAERNRCCQDGRRDSDAQRR